MGNSPLVTYTKISPNRTSPRNHKIDTISIHVVAAQGTAKWILNLSNFVKYDNVNGSSCNYAVGYDGSIGLCVEEKDRSWCTSNRANDNRAITIEVSCEPKHPYVVTDAAYKALIDLLVDICKRNPGIGTLKWQANKALIGQVDKQNMTVHRWFANKACPGDYLYQRHAQIAAEVNARLGGAEFKPEKPADENNNETNTEVCEVNLPVLRKGANSGYVKTLQILLNKYNKANLTEDGDFGSKTYAAVTNYQKSRGLTVDGVVGSQTWAYLLK